ncbi:hypothetical protein [Mycobacterium haemophilum]|nr:hypothetical protein [Mycobacterium haemophilum]
MSELADIGLTISSVMQDWQYLLGGHDDDDDLGPTGLSYTDASADYPPLSRNYEDVVVTIGSEDEVKPRTYTDQDHQVWRL